jgi:hypothetical protein
MDIQSKLDSIQEQRQTLLTLTPTQQISKNLSKLYVNVVEARDTEKNAPMHVKETERRYYKAKYGADYKYHLKSQFVKESRELRQKMIDEHLNQLGEMDKSLSVYDSVRTYLQNITEVHSVILTQIKKWLDKIRRSDINTNNRKSFYMEQEQKNISTWILVCNCFILAYCGSILFEYREDLKTPIIAGTLVTLLSVVFLLPFIVKMIVKLPRSVNVYTEWGYDPTESKTPWMVMIPIGMGLLYGCLWLDS